MSWQYILLSCLVTAIALGSVWYSDTGFRRPTFILVFLSVIVIGSSVVSYFLQVKEIENQSAVERMTRELAENSVQLLRTDSARTEQLVASQEQIIAMQRNTDSLLRYENDSLRSTLAGIETRQYWNTLRSGIASLPDVKDPNAQFGTYWSTSPSGPNPKFPCGLTAIKDIGKVYWRLRTRLTDYWSLSVSNCDCDSSEDRQFLFWRESQANPLNTWNVDGNDSFIGRLCLIDRRGYSGLFVGSTYDTLVPPLQFVDNLTTRPSGCSMEIHFTGNPDLKSIDSLFAYWEPMLSQADIRVSIKPDADEYLVVPLKGIYHVDHQRKCIFVNWGNLGADTPRRESGHIMCVDRTSGRKESRQ